MNDKDVLIKQLMQRIESLLEKNSATSSKPPSSDILHPQPTRVTKMKKRKRSGQAGHSKHIRQPFSADAIDETIVHKFLMKKWSVVSLRNCRRRCLYPKMIS
jgi:hypothetical protein